MRELEIVPVEFDEAVTFVRRFHRHHKPPKGHKFSIGCARVSDGEIVGVAIVGRPVARLYQDGLTLEVTRACTPDIKNVNSCLYGAAARAAFALGYRRLITYTRADESGTSLRAADWKCIAQRPARSWNMPGRPRVDKSEPYERLLWEKTA